MDPKPETLVLIAGQDNYPLLLARAAKQQGVSRLVVCAFKGETRREIESLADEVVWLKSGQLGALLDVLRNEDFAYAVMAGQISPKIMFLINMDQTLKELLRSLPVKNAHTIFGAITDAMEACGIELLPASSFMSDFMPKEGLLTKRAPTERELTDATIGRRVVKDCSHLDIGQTVVVKDGMILAVEAFEGTNRAIARGGKLGGKGAVVCKVPKIGHDMRFDIPVVGMRTLKSLKKAGISCFALEEGGAIFLQRESVVERANQMGLAITVLRKETH